MTKKRFIVLGGGISGLATAWYLSKLRPNDSCTLLEKESRIGGYVFTEKCDGYLFETGPRVFKTSKNATLLNLIEDLGFKSKVVVSSREAHNRYIWHKEKLCKVPGSFPEFLHSPWLYPICKALITEWKKPVEKQEESVWDFVCRRLGKRIAEDLFDPLVQGIYAGDTKMLSMEACFPLLKQWEIEHGSLTNAFLRYRKLKKNELQRSFPPPESLFTFEGGMSCFLQKWTQIFSEKIHLNQDVKQIRHYENRIEIITQDHVWEADAVFCALPAKKTADLLAPFLPEVSHLLKEIPCQPITSVNVGFSEDVLSYDAFGYLIPSRYKEKILGAMFDSKMFPSQYQFPTLLTFMMKGVSFSDEEIKNEIQRALFTHLHISKTPSFFHISRMPEAIPQYALGHLDKVKKIETLLQKKERRCHLVGNYLYGVSVNDCIERAKNEVEHC